MESKQVTIGYGVLCEPIAKQLKKQGFKYNHDTIKRYEKELQALNMLRFGSGILTDSMFDKILTRLHKKIIAHVKHTNKTS